MSPRNSRILKWTGLSAVVLVPLAFAGLFVGALAQSDSALDRIPAAIVNEDEMITTTDAAGQEQIVFAGRQLVTELTGAEGFDWTITNAEAAQDLLDSGQVYAILTVPEDFSESILSLSTSDPVKADIAIQTDDSHSYLTGSVAQVVGQTMTDTFGKAITAQYIGGIYASMGDLGASLTAAADGATELSNGASSLGSGLQQYSDGVASLESGLWTISNQTAGLGQLSSGVSQYTAGVSQISDGLAGIAPYLTAPTPELQAQFQQLVGGLQSVAAGGPALASGAAGLPALHDGITQAAAGASELADNGPALVSGATGLASGAAELATGLQSGADQIPATDTDAAAASAEIVADPVGLTVSTENAVTDVGQAVATFFVPLGLWVGAL
ncbi:MAG: YhgE/Pip family protein, partial [Rhodoglobus sp.]|nr:YhgE/Pip family protein [Rhodoglobus sp.]